MINSEEFSRYGMESYWYFKVTKKKQQFKSLSKTENFGAPENNTRFQG